MMAPTLPQVAEHFNITSETILAMTLSIFLVTFAIGPLFLSPLSEIYGRTWVCQTFYVFRSKAKYLTFRFLAGIAYRKPSLPGVQYSMCICSKCRCTDCYATNWSVF